MANSIFIELGIVLIIATTLAYIAKRFKQPLIPAYIIAGILLGPGIAYLAKTVFFQQLFGMHDGFLLIQNQELIRTLSEIGVAFLLFMVGLEINFKQLKEVKEVTIIGALLKSVLLFFITIGLTWLFHLTLLESAYLAIIIVFSSTMVVMKILSDQKIVDTLHAKIIIGILLVQDILAILVLFTLTSSGSFSLIPFLSSTAIATLFIFCLIVLGSFVWPRLFRHISDSGELLFLSAVAVCFFFAILFNLLGFSIAIGAFIAGITLGNVEYHFEIIGRVRAIRDFFLVLFFVSLGMQLTAFPEQKYWLLLGALFLLVTVVKPLIIMIVVSLFGYHRKTAFLTGMFLGNISEFSLIIAAQGLALGQVSQPLFTIIIVLALLSIGMTEYFAVFSSNIVHIILPYLGFLDRFQFRKQKSETKKPIKASLVLIGCNRIGSSILHRLLKKRKKPLVIDFNPKVIKSLTEIKVPHLCGDISNNDILEQIDLKSVTMIISTITDYHATVSLLKKTKERKRNILVIVTASHLKQALALYEMKADYVLLPTHLSAEHISLLMTENLLKTLKKAKHHHRKELMRLHQALYGK